MFGCEGSSLSSPLLSPRQYLPCPQNLRRSSPTSSPSSAPLAPLFYLFMNVCFSVCLSLSAASPHSLSPSPRCLSLSLSPISLSLSLQFTIFMLILSLSLSLFLSLSLCISLSLSHLLSRILFLSSLSPYLSCIYIYIVLLYTYMYSYISKYHSVFSYRSSRAHSRSCLCLFCSGPVLVANELKTSPTFSLSLFPFSPVFAQTSTLHRRFGDIHGPQAL